ncbi:MAG: phytochelatin synthase family protein [Anaeromyxobacteraceae bacterium]
MPRSVETRPELLAKAWALPVAARYAPLRSQGFRAVCGPTSVTNVLRSLGHDRGANPLRGFGLRAMSLEQVVREGGEVMPPGWTAAVVRPSSVAALRDELRTSNDPRRRFIANFSRAPLFGRGGGHHSPVGGYLEAEDLAFVLDVNSSFGPWLVPTELLHQAMSSVDRGDGRARGLARFEAGG